MNENYYEAALRHFVDAITLENEEAYDNAVYLFGNSAECALKTLLKIYCGVSGANILKGKYGHELNLIARDLSYFITNSSAVGLLDPALGLKQQMFNIPEILFRNHPERRYAENETSLRQDIVLYSTEGTQGDARVRAFVERLGAEAYKSVVARIEAWFGEGDIIE